MEANETCGEAPGENMNGRFLDEEINERLNSDLFLVDREGRPSYEFVEEVDITRDYSREELRFFAARYPREPAGRRALEEIARRERLSAQKREGRCVE